MASAAAAAASPGDARPRCTALQNLPLTLLVSDLALLHCVPLLPPPPLRSPLTRSPDGRRRPRWCPPSLRRSRRRRRLCGCLCHLENVSKIECACIFRFITMDKNVW
ncbi:Os06g0209700 [Oryza sativa Japonica Group]|uniref:Os06g0209700 protein n=3 Tax=Oryza TaxID=4527 RepID=B7E8Q6_ORYSJ|nr:hypothetical protein EE612_032615 [Oryza sativa]KAF2925754.1 hypothetical protein DAI22_06g075600 [Oryza sativa Japonica Group]KAF2925756.1 hypothetical protein DAI22_06g075600 [Oryza sativa Japonica Group]BAG88753.1 unnamed protein product [Oryza sativa Japonica Group]BAS96732.1 Os06g0209700 [Oryza sativa Japonica Group]